MGKPKCHKKVPHHTQNKQIFHLLSIINIIMFSNLFTNSGTINSFPQWIKLRKVMIFIVDLDFLNGIFLLNFIVSLNWVEFVNCDFCRSFLCVFHTNIQHTKSLVAPKNSAHEIRKSVGIFQVFSALRSVWNCNSNRMEEKVSRNVIS